MLLLDTHTWIWVVEDDTHRIGRDARQAVGRAEVAGHLRVSPVSFFEITALCTSGRLRLSMPPHAWLSEAISAAAIRVAELTPAVAIDAGAIPREALADPMDRLLVASARQLGATLLTADARILIYARETANVRVQDASL
jgi:PIN domain nuclease of toxin-antitoxin system